MYAKRYEEDDELLLAAAGSEQLQRRTQLRTLWEEWHQSKADWIRMQDDNCMKVWMCPSMYHLSMFMITIWLDINWYVRRFHCAQAHLVHAIIDVMLYQHYMLSANLKPNCTQQK